MAALGEEEDATGFFISLQFSVSSSCNRLLSLFLLYVKLKLFLVYFREHTRRFFWRYAHNVQRLTQNKGDVLVTPILARESK